MPSFPAYHNRIENRVPAFRNVGHPTRSSAAWGEVLAHRQRNDGVRVENPFKLA